MTNPLPYLSWRCGYCVIYSASDKMMDQEFNICGKFEGKFGSKCSTIPSLSFLLDHEITDAYKFSFHTQGVIFM